MEERENSKNLVNWKNDSRVSQKIGGNWRRLKFFQFHHRNLVKTEQKRCGNCKTLWKLGKSSQKVRAIHKKVTTETLKIPKITENFTRNWILLGNSMDPLRVTFC